MNKFVFFIASLFIVVHFGTNVEAEDIGQQISNAGNSALQSVKGAWQEVTKFFTDKYKSAADLAAKAKQVMMDVTAKLDDTKKYINNIVENSDTYMQAAKNQSNQKAQDALKNINTWKDEINRFDQDNKGLGDSDYLTKWNDWVKAKSDAGLDEVIKVGNNMKNGAPKTNSLITVGLTLLIPILIKTLSL